MKLKNWSQIVFIFFCLSVFFACNDEDGFSPISLTYTEGNDSPIRENILTVDPFDEDGIPFRIVGGDNGRYIIHNSNPQVIDCDYNGDVLNIVPVTVGSATVKITDNSGNSYTLQVDVAYPTLTCPISEVKAEVYGDNLTGKQIEAIETAISESALAKEGGSYVFTFRDKEQTYGTVEIYPSEYDKPLGGNFKFTQPEGYAYTLVEITLPDGTSHRYILKPYATTSEAGEVSYMTLQEDVTDTYKGLYPALERAYSYQIFPNAAAQ